MRSRAEPKTSHRPALSCPLALSALAALLPWVNGQVCAAMAAEPAAQHSALALSEWNGPVSVLSLDGAQVYLSSCVAACLTMLDCRVTPPPSKVSAAAVHFLQVGMRGESAPPIGGSWCVLTCTSTLTAAAYAAAEFSTRTASGDALP
jgi:hypothetical protein